MSQAPDISSIDSTEAVVVSWDFSNNLGPNEEISSVQLTACSVHTGDDPAAASRLSGATTVGKSLTSGKANALVSQLFSGGVGGVRYLLLCTVLTSDAQILSVWMRAPCVTPF
jgi:hypothetical protein